MLACAAWDNNSWIRVCTPINLIMCIAVTRFAPAGCSVRSGRCFCEGLGAIQKNKTYYSFAQLNYHPQPPSVHWAPEPSLPSQQNPDDMGTVPMERRAQHVVPHGGRGMNRV